MAVKKSGLGLRDVGIPSGLFEKIELRIKGSEFGTVSDYVSYVLREVLAAEEAQEREGMGAGDEAKVKERLKSLGYMD